MSSRQGEPDDHKCWFSTSIRHSCQTDPKDQSKLECTKLHQVYRHCPNKSPEMVSSTETHDTQDQTQQFKANFAKHPFLNQYTNPTHDELQTFGGMLRDLHERMQLRVEWPHTSEDQRARQANRRKFKVEEI